MERDDLEIHKSAAIEQIIQPPLTPLQKKLRKRAPKPVVHTKDPIAELRRLVGIHKTLTTDIQRLDMAIKDRKIRSTGEVVKCTRGAPPPPDYKRAIDTCKEDQNVLVASMLSELKRVPIYQVFLSKVYGVGGVTAAYLAAMVRIEKAPNFSNLNRYCGNAPDHKTGKHEIRNGAPKEIGGTGTFNPAMRRNDFLILGSMRKNGCKYTICETHDAGRPKRGSTKATKDAFRVLTADCEACLATARPFGTTSKYLDRWHSASWSERTMPTPKKPNPDAKGRQKATDLFLWDLYIVWRALNGLDMRHDRFSVQRGHTHDGVIVDRDTRFSLTLEEALEWVGDVGGRPATGLMLWSESATETDEDEDS